MCHTALTGLKFMTSLGLNRGVILYESDNIEDRGDCTEGSLWLMIDDLTQTYETVLWKQSIINVPEQLISDKTQ